MERSGLRVENFWCVMCNLWCEIFDFFLGFWIYESRGDQKHPIWVVSRFCSGLSKWTTALVAVIYTLYLAIPHNSYGTQEFPDCGNLVGANWVENLRWDHMEPYVPFMWVHTEPSMHFRKANTEPSMHFKKANAEPSMYFRKANTKCSLPVLLPTPNFTSKFTPSFIPNISINLLHHDECNIISQVKVN